MGKEKPMRVTKGEGPQIKKNWGLEALRRARRYGVPGRTLALANPK